MGGAGEPAAQAARECADGLAGRTAALGTAGHVLDYDDTWLPGLAHLSAPVAPAALVVAADRGATVADLLDAYAAGFEAMAAIAGPAHPALYDGGWHPTAVCGSAGAAVAAAHLLGLDDETQDHAAALALLRAGGLRAAFGSDGKALQVGRAAAEGVEAARLAAAGARVDPERIRSGPDGFAAAFAVNGSVPGTEPFTRAIDEVWLKPWPCCLQAHGSIEAALGAREAARGAAVEVVVHPVSRQAAALDDVADPLRAKFSIPYLVAYALLRGEPGMAAFRDVDPEVREAARAITVRTDPALAESEAVLVLDGDEAARVLAARGAPQAPLDEATRARKIAELAGDRLDGLLEDPARLAGAVLEAVQPSK